MGKTPASAGYPTAPGAVRHRFRRGAVGAAVIVSALVVVLVGCGGGGGGKGTPTHTVTKTESAPTPERATETASPTPEKTETSQAPGVNAFGATHTYEDGLAVKVNKPVLYQPSATAAGHTPGNDAIKFTVTLTNGTGEVFGAVGTFVLVGAGEEGRQAEAIVDTERGVEGSFAGSVVSRASATATFAFDIPKGSLGKIDVEVQPGFDYTSEHWAGSVS